MHPLEKKKSKLSASTPVSLLIEVLVFLFLVVFQIGLASHLIGVFWIKITSGFWHLNWHLISCIYILRLVKPLALAMGIQEAFLLWGLGIGALFLWQNIHFLVLYHEYLSIDTYAILSLVVHKQPKRVCRFRGKSFPRVKALTSKTFVYQSLT